MLPPEALPCLHEEHIDVLTFWRIRFARRENHGQSQHKQREVTHPTSPAFYRVTAGGGTSASGPSAWSMRSQPRRRARLA